MAWQLSGLILLPLIAVEGTYDFAEFIPADANIRDCYVREFFDLSHVQCAMHAWRESIVALVYLDSTKICHLCLSPHMVGNQSRQALPEGHTVVIRGKCHVSRYSNSHIYLLF